MATEEGPAPKLWRRSLAMVTAGRLSITATMRGLQVRHGSEFFDVGSNPTKPHCPQEQSQSDQVNEVNEHDQHAPAPKTELNLCDSKWLCGM